MVQHDQESIRIGLDSFRISGEFQLNGRPFHGLHRFFAPHECEYSEQRDGCVSYCHGSLIRMSPLGMESEEPPPFEERRMAVVVPTAAALPMAV